MHTGEKPFLYSTCQHAYDDQSNLRVHMQAHMEVERWRSPHCIALFSRRSLLTPQLTRRPFSISFTTNVTNDVSAPPTLPQHAMSVPLTQPLEMKCQRQELRHVGVKEDKRGSILLVTAAFVVRSIRKAFLLFNNANH